MNARHVLRSPADHHQNTNPPDATSLDSADQHEDATRKAARTAIASRPIPQETIERSAAVTAEIARHLYDGAHRKALEHPNTEE